MNLHIWQIDSDELKSMPKAEKKALIVLGHSLNEINVFHKLFCASTNGDYEETWNAHGQTTQALVMARTLAGKLHSSWEVLGKVYFKSQLSKTYGSYLEAVPKSSLKELGKYFSGKNTISLLRNSFSFHYDPDVFDSALEHCFEEGELVSYMSEKAGNNLHYFSEHIVGCALMDSVNGEDWNSGTETLFADIQQVTRLVNDAFQGIMWIMSKHHLSVGSERVREIEMTGNPTLAELRMPYFLSL